MVVSRGKNPSAQETFVQMAQAAGLRSRLLLTVGLLILVRLGIFIPMPGIDRLAFSEAIRGGNLGGVVGFVDIFVGGGLSALGIFALGILPYINASIIMQLLTAAIPSLEDLQKNEGEAGRRKISQITRYVALGWAILQSTLLSSFLLAQFAQQPGLFFIIQTVIALTAGSMFVMWVGELITERGVGNGASLLIFLNIVSTLPRSLGQTIELAQSGDRNLVGGIVALLLVFLAMIVGIVFVQEGTRRIPIISARRQVGRKLYLEQSNYLPLRLNQGGVMPIIFASAVLVLPLSLTQFIRNPEINQFVAANFRPTSWLYVSLYLVLIVFFSFFYSSLIINPEDLSRNLKKMGASIPGIRPGKATSDYIGKVLNRLTFLGAIFLGLVAVIPSAVESLTRVPTFNGLGATSLLILVGVAIDTAKQVQTYVISQRYEGMVKQ
ncbi:preprotein translocase subunit SecY [Pseudanabaena sp. FACHB-2040]|uniref:preprotein translocase subunit SecY n=1 Tax=Pseudanabaena sp. FACHB-2040 TaxID=2692859 RepID=UPI0016851B26|nr:preprotein translocase subunit SecY [Pseudanabaena sp. FACHB-2040]MBD0267902.1 preprotein translocase subunit SecY [Cyanobacteria bacterium Co-bin8]MBD2258118.1 preprotein translocase subunit SecY [Pseudanabaena sp. FACHB-2040]